MLLFWAPAHVARWSVSGSTLVLVLRDFYWNVRRSHPWKERKQSATPKKLKFQPWNISASCLLGWRYPNSAPIVIDLLDTLFHKRAFDCCESLATSSRRHDRRFYFATPQSEVKARNFSILISRFRVDHSWREFQIADDVTWVSTAGLCFIAVYSRKLNTKKSFFINNWLIYRTQFPRRTPKLFWSEMCPTANWKVQASHSTIRCWIDAIYGNDFHFTSVNCFNVKFWTCLKWKLKRFA